MHNIEGSINLYFRQYDKIKNAMDSGEIVEKEARARKEEREHIEDVIKNLYQGIKRGQEPLLAKRISENAKKNAKLDDKAIKIIIMSAGNHNGERGRGHIIPKTRTFEEFYENAKKTFFNKEEDKNMVSCNIVDAIVKISDQLSSIPFDPIDGVRSGLEDNMNEEWAIPLSNLLEISLEEATQRLNGNNKELEKLAYDVQNKFVDNVIENSNENEINMSPDFEDLLYGKLNQNR